MKSTFYFLVFAFHSLPIYAHAHHEVSDENLHAPLDVVLFLHIGLQSLAWGVLFPIGMVLGLSRSRWHVPLQSLALTLTVLGTVLGHVHGGRQFPHSFHSSIGSWILLPIVVQSSLGIYLKSHLHEGTIRPYALRLHGILGCIWPILGWVQGLFGVILLRGLCAGGFVGECEAHHTMGSALIAGGILMAISYVAGENWVRQSGRCPEWWDSWIIIFWGIVNTFTEHIHDTWEVIDMQHTALGVIWWAGGLLGIYLSRNNQRNVIPGLIFALTGWAMLEHTQETVLSTKVHAMFGCMLMLAGFTRIIDVCFISVDPSTGLRDDNLSERTFTGLTPGINANSDPGPKVKAARAFRHLPPISLIAAGILLMSATDDELDAIQDIGMDHVTYILAVLSVAFVLYLFSLFLIDLYATSGKNADSTHTQDVVFSTSLNNAIELVSPRDAHKWYTPIASEGGGAHALGGDAE